MIKIANIRKTPENLFKKYPKVMSKKKEKYEIVDNGRILARRGTKKEAQSLLKRIK